MTGHVTGRFVDRAVLGDGADARSAHRVRVRHAEATVAAAVAPLGRVLRPAEQRALLVHRLLSLRELCVRAGAVLDAVARTLATQALRLGLAGRASHGRLLDGRDAPLHFVW